MIRVDTAARLLTFGAQAIPCTIGRAGACVAADKREGDGRTPLGIWRLETILLRPGRAAPPPGLALPWRWIGPATWVSIETAKPEAMDLPQFEIDAERVYGKAKITPLRLV